MWFLFLLWALFGQTVKGQSALMYLAQDGCFTNTSSAMGAVYNLSTDWQRQTETVLKTTSTQRVVKKVNLKIKNDGNLKLRSSLELGSVNNLITDRRWEELHTHFTKPVDDTGTILKYEKVATINSSDFQVPFSVQVRYEAYVFLCDGTDVTTSNCYCFILDGWKGTKSGFKQCRAGEIQIIRHDFVPLGGCSHTEYFNENQPLMNESRWNHYQITKLSSELVLRDQDGAPIFTKQLEPNSYLPRYVLVHTKFVNGLWKIHDFICHYFEKAGSTIYPALPKNSAHSVHQCLAVFVSLCSSCRMELKFTNSKLKTSYTITGNPAWNEHVICFDVDQSTVTMKVHRTLDTEGSPATAHPMTPFWIMSRIEIRSHNEPRWRHLKPIPDKWTGTCQYLSSGHLLSRVDLHTAAPENCGENKDDELGEAFCGKKPDKYCELQRKSNNPLTTKCYMNNHSNKTSCKTTGVVRKVPNKVDQFEVLMPNGTALIKWRPPVTSNGVLLYYTVSIQLQRHLACQLPSGESPQFHYVSADGDNYFKVSKLKAYAEYQASIRPYSSAGFWPATQISFTTQPRDSIAAEEVPHVDVLPDIDNATFAFRRVNCSSLQGPLSLTIDLKGRNEWCQDSIQRIKSDNLTDTVEVAGLKPFCSYEAVVKFSRGQAQKTKTITFNTKEGVPHQVTDLLVTSKGPDYVTLRWRPPYPPTGHLETYNIQVKQNRWYWESSFYPLGEHSVTPTPCRLWKEFHCATLPNNLIFKDYVYLLEVTAKNRGCPVYSQAVSVKMKAEESKPDPPYGLKATWSPDNQLTLAWHHPNRTSGILQSFSIRINQTHFLDYPIHGEDDYRLEYRTTISERLKSASPWSVEVTARNSYWESDPIALTVYSPPPVPRDNVDEIYWTRDSIEVTLKEDKKDVPGDVQQFLYTLVSPCDCENELSIVSDLLQQHHQNKAVPYEKNILTANWKLVNTQKLTAEKSACQKLVIDNQAQSGYLGFIWIHEYHGHVRIHQSIHRVPYYVATAPTSNWSEWKWLLFLLIPLGVVFITSWVFCWSRNRTVDYKIQEIEKRFAAASKAQMRRLSASRVHRGTHDEIPLSPIRSARSDFPGYTE